VEDSWVALFDRVAASYDTVVPFFSSFGEMTVDALPAPGPGARLLDVGAGAGAITLAARRRGYDVSAVDGSAGMVARLPGSMLADAADLPFADASFDVVTAGFMVHLLSDPVAGLREFRRVLVPGGLLACTVPEAPPPGFEPADRASEIFAEFARGLPAGERLRTRFDARGALAEAGFREVTERHLRFELRLDDPETMWRWCTTHGPRRFLDALDEGRREELHRRLVADLAARPEVVLRRPALLVTAIRPAA
jgi:ubiquinone/menaquinone biosynthesis C-methylase UbiE